MKRHGVRIGYLRLSVMLMVGMLLLLVLTACTGDEGNAETASTLPETGKSAVSGPESQVLDVPSVVEETLPTSPEEGSVDELLGEEIAATNEVTTFSQTVETTPAPIVDEEVEVLPLLIDLGAGKCIPCKMMTPVLEELAETMNDSFEVVFFDVWEDRSKSQEYGVHAIPTQIFYSAQGEELFRHEGFYSRNQILKKWRELGVDVGE